MSQFAFLLRIKILLIPHKPTDCGTYFIMEGSYISPAAGWAEYKLIHDMKLMNKLNELKTDLGIKHISFDQIHTLRKSVNVSQA